MKCILVFDQLNDILFSKCDKRFLKHVHKLGRSQGLDCKDNAVSKSMIMLVLTDKCFEPRKILSFSLSGGLIKVKYA